MMTTTEWQASEIKLTPPPLWQVDNVFFDYLKYNPYHDELGRFAEGPGDGGGGIMSIVPEGFEEQFSGGGGASAGSFSYQGYKITPNKDGEFDVYYTDKLVGTYGSKADAMAFADESVQVHGGGGGPKAPLTADDLPKGYNLSQNAAGQWEVGAPGVLSASGKTPEEALTNYANNWPNKMAPGMHAALDTEDINNPKPYQIKDATGEVKGSGASYAEALVDFKSKGGPLGQQSIVGQLSQPKTTLTESDLPSGYYVKPDPEGGGYQVINPDGWAVTHGTDASSAVSNFASSHPTEMAGIPDVSVDGTSQHGFSQKDLPPGYQLTASGASVAPWAVTNNLGSVVGVGESPMQALDHYFSIYPAMALPAGYGIVAGDVGFDVTDDKGVPIAHGNTKAEAVTNWKSWMSPDPEMEANIGVGNKPSGSSHVIEGKPATGPITPLQESDLPAGVHLVSLEETSSASGYPFKVYDEKGHSYGGTSPEAAVRSYFTNEENANKLLPSGYTIHADTDNGRWVINNSAGQTVASSVRAINHTAGDAVQEWKAAGSPDPNKPGTSLADLPEARFGTGAGLALESLQEAGGTGFGVQNARDRNHDYANQPYDPNTPIDSPSTHHFSSDDRQLIYSYTGSGNHAINSSLRYDTKPDSYVAARIAQLDRMFADSRTSKAMVLYRGIGENEKARIDAAIKAGRGHYVDKAFPETSTDRSTAGGWKSGDYIEIHLPPGSPAFDAKPYSSHKGENEWIIARNQLFKIDKVEKSEYGYGGRNKYVVHLVNQKAPSERDKNQLKLPFSPVNETPSGGTVKLPLTSSKLPLKKKPYDEADKFSYDTGDLVYLDDDEVNAFIRRNQQQTQKWNPFHDLLGRFSSGNSGGSAAPVEGPSTHEMTTVEHYALGAYTAYANRAVNDYLRKGENAPDALGRMVTDKTISAMDRVFANTRTGAPMTLYRGLSTNAVKKLSEAFDNKQRFRDKGFVSTSSDERVARKWRGGDYASIEVPAGSPALDAKGFTVHPNESEWLLDRDHEFEVTKREPTRPGFGTHFTLRLIPKVSKYNPHHDEQGRFTTGDGGGASALAGTAGEIYDGEEIASLGRYSVSGYRDLNHSLRHSDYQPDDPGAVAQMKSGLDSAFAKAPASTRDMELYRGISKKAAARLEQAGVGARFTDKGYVSTSRNVNEAELFSIPGGAQVHIYVPKGTKMIDMESYSNQPDEREMLLPRNSAFEITGTETNASGDRVINVKLVKANG